MPYQTKISVITICRNAENLIRNTMLSVLDQSYQSIEYIIVDGCSTDETLTVVNEVLKEYPSRTVSVISEPDKGIADAMNKGIRLATGEVIIHLHAGDRFVDSSMIEKVMNSYQQENWRWAVAGSIVVDSAGHETHVYRAHPDPQTLLSKNCIPHQSTFLQKTIFDVHGMFDVDYKQAMDYELWLRFVFQGGERYVVLPFDTTYFLDGGRSANILELLRYLRRLRKALHRYRCNVHPLSDVIFLLRVLVFHYYYTLKKRWISL